MNIIKIIAVIFTGVIFIGGASAGQFATSYGKITVIRSYGTADDPNPPTYIQVAGTTIASGCVHSDWGKGDLNFWRISPTETQLLSIILMAYSTGREVKITSNNDPSYIVGGACRVVYIDLK